jgi:FdhD protein
MSHQTIPVHRYKINTLKEDQAGVIVEAPLALTVNNETWLTFMCTPTEPEALAVGFLFNEGIITGVDEVADVRLCEHGDNVDVWLTHAAEQPAHWRRTSGCTGGVSAVDLILPSLAPRSSSSSGRGDGVMKNSTLTTTQVTSLMSSLLESQDLYRLSGGVHTSALSDGKDILVVTEDIGRHNTLDKIAGLCLMKDIWPERRILLTTGRVSSEMMQKAARMGAEAILSRTAPSSLSVEMAEKAGITLIGYTRRDRFTVYSHVERIRVGSN